MMTIPMNIILMFVEYFLFLCMEEKNKKNNYSFHNVSSSDVKYQNVVEIK